MMGIYHNAQMKIKECLSMQEEYEKKEQMYDHALAPC